MPTEPTPPAVLPSLQSPIPPSTLTFTSIEDCLRQAHDRIAPDMRAFLTYLETNDPNLERRYNTKWYTHPLFTIGAYYLEGAYNVELGATGGGKPGYPGDPLPGDDPPPPPTE